MIIIEFCLRFVICLGKLILFEGSVYIFFYLFWIYMPKKRIFG